MLSLPAELDTLCFSLFVQCDEFDSTHDLRAVFVTTDLAPFAHGLPERNGSKKTFVTVVKLFLLEKRLADGRVLLLPFLDTLRGRYSQQDALHGDLSILYQRLLALPEATASAGQVREARQNPADPADARDTAQPVTPVQLLAVLDANFSTAELNTLCFDLAIDFENLEGGTKRGKAQALIQYCQRRGRFLELVQFVQKARPNATF